ncbi:hypothetical protein [Kitasatospora sp. NPDC059571]|uniref:hypothetical protein n=1 Tax=Kitasatospora sp. NPDC059571 TaxID=3346871 RepID=UPI0036A3625C
MITTAVPALTLADLTARTGLDVLDHLEREVTIPVVAGPQAQGDLIVIPMAMLPHVRLTSWASSQDVPAAGIELLRSAAGGNPHSLVADPGTCRWTLGVHDPVRLALGLLEASAVAYLIHPEHGATGIAPGRYLIRRQRERDATGLGFGFARAGNRMVCD